MVKFRGSFVLCCVVASLTGAVLAQGADAFSRKPSVRAGAEPVSTQSAPAGDNQVWITRADGAQSCSPKSGQSLEEGAADLKRAKVRVLESRKANDGKLHMQMCGAPSGSANAFLIPKDDLPQAVALGYVQSK